jgi:hypothetical protein
MPVAYVKAGTRANVSGGSSIAPSLGSVVAGNLVVAVVSVGQNGANPGNIAAPSGWSDAISPNGTNAIDDYDSVSAIFYKENSAGGTETCSITVPSGSYGSAIIMEFSGVATSGALDVTDSKANTAMGTSVDTGAGVTNTLADSVAVVVMSAGSGSSITNSLSTPPSSGYTSVAYEASDFIYTAFSAGYKILSATGSQSASWTWTGNGAATACLAVFKGVGGGGGSTRGTPFGQRGTAFNGGRTFYGPMR